MNRIVLVLTLLLLATLIVACPPDDDDDNDNDDATPSDDDSGDDDSVDDDDDTIDDDAIDDDTIDDDSGDDDSGDDDTTDDDTTDDDTSDDDTSDDDTADDDTIDDDTIDDDTIDDDTADDDTGIIEPETEIVLHGRVGSSGGDIAPAPDGCLVAVAAGEHRLFLYTISLDAELSSVEEIVAEGLYSSPVVTVDGAGARHVIAQASDNDLYYFTDAGGDWTVENLTPGELEGASPHLRHDDAGALHLAFRRTIDGQARIVYATNGSGAWVETVVNPDLPTNADFHFDVRADGVAAVAYIASAKGSYLHFATNASGKWVSEAAAFASGFSLGNVNLVLDGAGYAHVAFSVSNGDDVTGVHYAANTSGVWEHEVVYQISSDYLTLSDPTLVVDSDGAPHVHYLENSGYLFYDTTYYATRSEAGEWSLTSLTSGSATYLKATIDDADEPHLLSCQYSGSLMYHAGLPEPWPDAWLILHDGSAFASWTPVAINPLTGRPHLVFQGSSNFSVFHEHKESGVWTTETIGYAGIGGYDPEIAMDPQGHAHVVYNDWYEDRIVYATDQSGAWQLTTVDETYNLLLDPAIALDAAGFVHIVFMCREMDNFLRYATNRGGTWRVENIATDDYQSFLMPRIAVTADDTVFIAYHHAGDLYLTEKAVYEDQWQTAMVAADADSSVDLLQADRNGRPHLAYMADDPTSGEPTAYYAYRDAGQWLVETVGVAGDFLTSMILDGEDYAHLTYLTADDRLRYATNMTGDWTEATLEPFGSVRVFLAIDGYNLIHAVYTSDSTLWHNVFPRGYTNEEIQ